jgi:hypothetical protein
MSRLRRRTDTCLGTPVSAEVLEKRALLSAGAAAVHQAQVHQASAVHDAGLTPRAGDLTATAFIDLPTGGSGLVPGEFTSLTIGKSIGNKVSFKFQGLLNEGGGNSVAGNLSFTGKISNVSGPAVYRTFTVTPTGGTFLLTYKTAGKVTSIVSGQADPAPFTFTELSGHVADVRGIYDVGPVFNTATAIDIKVSG